MPLTTYLIKIIDDMGCEYSKTWTLITDLDGMMDFESELDDIVAEAMR